MFQVATLKATPVGERWLGAFGALAHPTSPTARTAARMSFGRDTTLEL
jgi:hypothetical protein